MNDIIVSGIPNASHHDARGGLLLSGLALAEAQYR